MASSRLIVVNNTRQDVDFVWVRPNGSEKRYETVASGDYFKVWTFDTHVWRIKKTTSQVIIREYTAGPYFHIMDVIEYTDTPDRLTCDITLNFMHDPVRASDGHVYDLSTVHKIFQHQSDPVSPFTREPLTRKLIIERDIANACAKYAQDHDCVHPSRQLLFDLMKCDELFQFV